MLTGGSTLGGAIDGAVMGATPRGVMVVPASVRSRADVIRGSGFACVAASDLDQGDVVGDVPAAAAGVPSCIRPSTSCTFEPTLNSKSNDLAEGGRSVVELSRGDHLRKETTQKMLRLRHEQSQMKELTFHPKVNHSNKVARNASSRLKIVEDPDNYLSRLQQNAKHRKDTLRRKAQELEMKTLEECTFRPQTSECPGYIKRIARSMALTKVDKQEGIEAGKPEWR